MNLFVGEIAKATKKLRNKQGLILATSKKTSVDNIERSYYEEGVGLIVMGTSTLPWSKISLPSVP